MDINKIVEEYSTFDITQGIEKLLKMRQNLAILIMDITQHIAKLEEDAKEITARKKIELAVNELKQEGTGQDRKAKAIREMEGIIMQESEYEGQLKAYRIKFEGMKELSNSMSSYLNKM